VGVVAYRVALAGFRFEREAGVELMWQKTRREPASSLIFLRASAICSLVRNQSCSMSEGADEINEILVSLSRKISFL